jgi:signal transduction histidine kinase
MRFISNYLEKKNLALINRSDYATDLNYLKDVIFIKSLVYVYSLSILVLIPGIFYGIIINNYWVVFWDVLTYLSVLFLIYPTKIKLNIRKWIFVSVIYLLGFQLLMQLGMDGAGILFWIIGNISSSLLFNQIQLIYIVLVNIIVFSIITLIIYIGDLPPTFSTSLSIDDWVLISIHNIYLSIIISAVLNELLKVLERVLYKEKKLQQSIVNALLKTEQSIQLFERKNAKLEHIAYVTAKDIKTPLKQVEKDIQLLNEQLKATIDDKADKYLHFAAEGATKMWGLIAGMDKLSRIDQHEVRLEKVNIKQITTEIIESQFSNETQIDLMFDLAIDEFQSDAILLKRLIKLLLTNCIQFQNKNLPLLVNIKTKQEGEDKLLITITDNGIGVEKQHYDRIFQLYQRIHTQKDNAGSGIGLALAKRIVNKLNGEIWVRSKLNIGTSFTISLPLNTTYELD